MSDAGNNFNYECSVLWLSKCETNVGGKFNAFERQTRNMSTKHTVLMQVFITIYLPCRHAYEIIYFYRILCLLTQSTKLP
jgi:hypothetical protein